MALTQADVTSIAEGAEDRFALWSQVLDRIGAHNVAEIGVYRGAYAEHILDTCPGIETYYMVDPWRHLDDWNKPANRDDGTFERIYQEAMGKTEAHADKRVVLRGRTVDVIDQIPDGSLDFAYVDGDHTLRGISVDLVALQPKIRPGGWIGGDDLARSIWQHGEGYEPTLVFPFAVYFAEAIRSRVYALPGRQFLIDTSADEFEFVDVTGKYGKLDLMSQIEKRPASAAAPASGNGGRSLPRRVRARLSRLRR